MTTHSCHNLQCNRVLGPNARNSLLEQSAGRVYSEFEAKASKPNSAAITLRPMRNLAASTSFLKSSLRAQRTQRDRDRRHRLLDDLPVLPALMPSIPS